MTCRAHGHPVRDCPDCLNGFLYLLQARVTVDAATLCLGTDHWERDLVVPCDLCLSEAAAPYLEALQRIIEAADPVDRDVPRR